MSPPSAYCHQGTGCGTASGMMSRVSTASRKSVLSSSCFFFGFSFASLFGTTTPSSYTRLPRSAAPCAAPSRQR